ncbi:hypothetical protein ABL78_4086 [Leptomonas seymouri]|uniref:Uncharacterized protein n=1 Tax=Leptomonas seymouri TaxID=5684 RepID=A0A0N1I3Y7_LEPSE|nr:hypothetical protein ABL78_4086 [Leptomonas seymouri]|eukprot:KPI86850.1 hypothetical protein ABL78_4086 [Leptomonas seymouri]
MPRGAAAAAFPFEGAFDMQLSNYVLHLLCSRTPYDVSAPPQGGSVGAASDSPTGLRNYGCDLPYTRAEGRATEDIALWDRLGAVVHRCWTDLPSEVGRGGRADAFTNFSEMCPAPCLHVLLIECILPLLMRTLAEQRFLWVQATQGNAAHSRQFARRVCRQQGPRRVGLWPLVFRRAAPHLLRTPLTLSRYLLRPPVRPASCCSA